MKRLNIQRMTAFFLLVSALGLSACFALPVEEPVLAPPVLNTAQVRSYKTTSVTRGDVLSYKSISANYVAVDEATLYFAVDNVLIKAFYFEVGDQVRAGDIIAELDRAYYTREAESTEQELTRLQLYVEQLDERYALERLSADISGNPADEGAYLRERDALLLQIAQVNDRLGRLREEEERRVLRAPIDGTITYAMSYELGDVSTSRSRAVVVTDQTQSVLMVSRLDPELIDENRIYSMYVDWELYDARIISREEAGIVREDENQAETYFVLVGDNLPTINENTYASLYVVLDEVTDVLCLPNRALRRAGERTFVYVIEDGLKTTRDIELGLVGVSNIEVRAGLQEGEAVIID